jgi:hypothetical protein
VKEGCVKSLSASSFFRMRYRCIPDWPPLVWVALCPHGSSEINVSHGPNVETSDRWFCEAVWDGDFIAGDFDQTDLVFGSGACVREGGIMFITSGSTVDRLQCLTTSDGLIISNSLPCLLQQADISIDAFSIPDTSALHRIVRGIHQAQIELVVAQRAVRLLYFDNYLWSGAELVRQEKPYSARSFKNYHDYTDFLRQSISRLARNGSDHRRRQSYSYLERFRRDMTET